VSDQRFLKGLAVFMTLYVAGFLGAILIQNHQNQSTVRACLEQGGEPVLDSNQLKECKRGSNQ
jgi:hypothetical protein